MVIDIKNKTNRKNSQLKTTENRELGDGENYPEYKTGIKRCKYEKETETDGRSNVHLTGILEGKKRENNIWRDNGYEFFWIEEKH